MTAGCKIEVCGLSPTGLRILQGINRAFAGLVACLTSLKTWFLLDLKLWKEMPMRKAFEFGFRVLAVEILYAIGVSCVPGVLPG